MALDCWNGTIAGVQSFIEYTGYTIPVLRNAGYLQYTGPGLYGIYYDNYVVIDARGIVRYTSVGEAYGQKGRFDDAHLRAAIQQALPVESHTWSKVKALYR